MKTTGGSQPVIHVPRPDPGDPFRVIVVATDEHVMEPLREELEARAGGRPARVRIVAPALAESFLEHASGNVDESRKAAQDRLAETMDTARDAGLDVDGRVGDSDPVLAIEDALRESPAEELVLVTHHEGERWLEDDLFDRVRRRFDIPVAHYEIGADGKPIERERSDGADPPADPEVETSSKNLPPLSIRDLAGIAVAIIGTIVLFVLASADSEAVGETRDGSNPAQIAQLVIAGAFALINLAHIVGLLLFGSVQYRGLWERFFANVSLFGTLGAIVVVLILR